MNYLQVSEALGYESVMKGTILYDQATFQSMKDEMDASYEEQEKEYGSMKNIPIIGKDTLVEYLKSYRDSLKTMVDSSKKSFSAFG